MEGFLTIREAAQKYIQGCGAKVHTPPLRLLLKAVMAGAMIALGAAASSVAAHGIADVGLSRLVSGCVFPVGLMMVVLLGAELFTGDCLAAMGVMDGKISLGSCARMLLVVYAGNFIGGVLVALLVYASGQMGYSGGMLGAYAIKVAVGKVNGTFLQGLASGTLCNVLVCAAVLMALCARDVPGKLLSCFFAIMLFVTAGYEHCVANMYYVPMGMLAAGDPALRAAAAEAYGLTAEQLAGLTLPAFAMNNLLPVTLGNILGGVGLVAAPVYYLNK